MILHSALSKQKKREQEAEAISDGKKRKLIV